MRKRQSTTTSAGREWLELLNRILAGSASEQESDAFQANVIDGRILLSSANQSVGAGRDITQSVIMVGQNRLHIRLGDKQLETLRDRAFSKAQGLPPPFPSVLFLGREHDMDIVRQHLARVGPHQLLIVRGWPGVGKTTLVSAIGRDSRLLKHFPDGVLWTSLGQKPNLLSAFSSWGSALGTDAILRAPTEKAAIGQLSMLLATKRMLLMVDDVWDPSDLAPFLAARGSKCAVVATTRESTVADLFTVSQTEVYRLPVLDEPYALELFQAIAPEIVRQHPVQCRELVRALECLPLAIHVAARLLATESRLGWGVHELVEELKTGDPILTNLPPGDRLDGESRPTVAALLRKSTDLLSSAAREYYAFLGVFPPKPATFDLAMLRGVWEVEDPRPIVRELAGHGLLEPAGQGRFQMHALLVAHARSLLE